MNENENQVALEKESQAEPKKYKRRGDVWVFIACVVLAFVLWGYVMSMESPTSERTFNGVKVSISNMERLNENNNLSIVSENTDLVVDVILQGKKSVLSKLTSDDIKAYIDVGNITESGTHSLDIKYLPFPDGTTFAGSSSGAMSLKFDVTSSVVIPIVVKYDNCIIPEGYSVGDYILSVDTLSVEGAKADLDKVKQAVITISTGTLTKSLTVRDAVPMICDKNGREVRSDYISYDRTYVDVKLPVYLQKDVTLTYDLTYGLYNQDNSKIVISPSKVTVMGEASVIDKLPDEHSVIKIDEKEGKESFFVSLENDAFGNGVEIIGLDRDISVSVTHKNTSTIQLRFDAENIKVNNPHNLKYHLPDDGLVVTFRCANNKLSYANVENIMAFIDLSSVGAAESSTMVSVTFSYTDLISGNVYEIGNHTVEVEFIQANG